jgi:hypothetical protein
MAKRVIIDEFHLTVLIPRRRLEPEADEIHRTSRDPEFENRLRRAARRLFRTEPSLGKVKVRLSR